MAGMKAGRCFSSASISQDNHYIFIFGGYDGKPIDSIER